MAENQIFIRTDWTLKKGTEIPEALDGTVLQVRRLALTDDVEEALRRVLIATGADEDIAVTVEGDTTPEMAHAIIDNANSVFALAAQKAAKDLIKERVKAEEDLPDADELQAVLDEYTLDPNQRRKGSGTKKERETLGKQVQALQQQADSIDESEAEILRKYGLLK